MTRISVVMPVYNGEDYVEAAISSILGQSYRDFEFIIIDDGSKDRTASIIAEAAARDTRIRLISRENRGIVASLNEGLSVAKCEFVARMDQDDIALPERFAKQVAFLDSHPDHCLVASHNMLIDPEARPLTSFVLPQKHEDILAMVFGGATCLCHPTVMYRRGLALEIGGYSDRFDRAEDIDFFLRLSERAKLAILPDLLLHYRLHPKSIGHVDFATQMKSLHRAIREAAERRNVTAPPEPDPVAGGSSEVDQYVRWAWWALDGKHPATARLYARKVLAARPFDRDSWRLAFCALRGR